MDTQFNFQNKLKKISDLFSQLVNVASDINVSNTTEV